MTNVLQVNRALAAKKNVFTLNSLFNADGQPTVNRQSAVALQSGTRSEKAPLSPSCLRYLSRIALIFAVLTLSIANIGMAWGDTTYYLQGISGSSGTSTLTSDFYTTASCNQTVSVTYDGISYTKAVKFGGNITAITSNNYPDRMIRYDCKTTRTDFVIVAYANSNSKILYYGNIKEGAKGSDNTITAYSTKTLNNGSLTTQEYSISSSTPASLFVSVSANSNAFVVQIIAIEKGDPLPTPGSVGYKVNFKKTRVVARSGAATSLDNNLEIHSNENITAGTTAKIKMQTKGTNYIKFTTTAACTAKITINGIGAGFYVADDKNATVNASELQNDGDKTYELEVGSGTHYIVPNGSNMYVEHIELAAASSCTAPSSVGISGDYAYLGGQTLSLTATPTGHTGTPTYQWQKEISSGNWQNISGATSATYSKSNIGYGDSGSYRCIVSTGATCSTTSDGYNVHVYSLNGGYEGEDWTAYNLTYQSGTTGQATVHLAAGKVYEFKISSNYGKWYGNAWYTLNDISNWEFTDGAGNMKILTGPEGDYTFTVDVANGQASSAKVNVSVAYPSVSHPNAGYVYITKWWDHCYVHYWDDSDNKITEWGSDAEATTYTTICGNNYYYMPALVDYHNLIIKDAVGDAGNTTGNQVTDDHGGKYITHDGSWGWHEFSTYTITYTGNGGGGSMSATSGICPDADQAITSNAYTAPTGCASFAHWTANVAVKVGGSTIAAGNPIANGATIQDINSNITLTAVWKLATPTITDKGDNTFSISGSMAGSSYYYTTNGSTPTTSSSLYSSAVDFSAGEANITAKAIAHKDGYVDSDVASQACTYHAPAVCEISDCGNATLTYPIYTSGDLSTSNLFSGASSTNATAVSVGASPAFTGVTVSAAKKGSAANAGACYAQSTALTGKMKYSASSKSSSYYIDFPFTVNSGYTFTPCDVQVVIQPVSSNQTFTVEITNGANVYGTSTATLNAGVMEPIIGLTSPAEMSAGNYAIRLYPHGGDNKEFRMGANVILKGTTAASGCTPPAAPTALGVDSKTTNSATLSWDGGSAGANGYQIALVSATGAGTFDWQNEAAATYTASGLTPSTTYTFKVRYKGTGGQCEFSDEVTCTFTTESPSLTALECNTRYTVQDMTAGGCGTLSGTSCYSAGISSNGRFEVLGDQSKTDQAGGTPEQKTNTAQTINSISFNSFMYLKGDGLNGSTEPTCRGVKFIIPTAGRLTIYYRYGDRSKLKKEGESAVNVGTTDGYGYDTHDVTAGTYYIYGASSGAVFIAVEYQCCTTPAAPTAFTAGSITSSGATFSITDAGDAASYDIFYSTSSDAPTASTVATTTSDSKTKSITGLTASTTYYAWVRSVCDASHKSAWVALTGSSFTTSAAAPVRDCEDLVNTIASSGTALSTSVGTATITNKSDQSSVNAIKLNSNGYITLSPKAGSSFAAGDSLIVTIYNQASGSKTTGFQIGGSEYTASIEGKTNYTFRMELAAAHIVDGKVQINRYNSDGWFVAAIIKTCDVLPPCTTPLLPSLSNQEVCAGNNGTAWDATITNEGLLATGETVSYEWKKKGSDAVLATTASYTPTSVTAADAGIYVVTATVSKTGNSDATASAEVTLTVKFTATPMVTMTPSSVSPGETATLTATSSEGATFAWYSCDNAAGENPVNVASTATYTTPALAAGSHYYKVVATGDGTHTCGTAELIYQVEVAIPEQCQTYYWFPYAADAGTNEVTNNEDSFFSGTKTGSSNGGTYNFSVDGENLTATKNTGGSSMTITFTIPSGKTGTLGINCKGSSSSPVYLTHSSGTPQTLISDNSSYGAFEITDIAAGTYTVAAGASGGQSWTLCGMAVKVCAACDATTMDVSDAAPTYDMSVGGDFTEPTFTVKHNGSALSPQPVLSYTSSNSAIATVNETTGALTFHGITGEVTITATFAGDGTYCASTGSYTLTINCGSEVAPKIVLDGGTNLAGCNTTITLHAKKQDDTDFTGGTYQWYRDGEAIDGATAASYTVARAGTYTVTRTGACIQQSTNQIVITNTETEPTVERLVSFQYYHEDKEYSDQMKNRHLFAVHSQGTHEGKVYSMTATRVSDDANVLSMVADALWVQSGGLSGVDTVMINLNLLVDKGLAAGDEVRFVCSAIACGGISPVNEDIILKVIDQTPTLAFICSGADGDGTRDKKNYVLHGDFLTGYNKADLCLQTGGTSFDKDQELPLYTALKEHYLITPVNGYAPFKLLNYEPFDLLLLTDFPKTKLNSNSRTAQATNKMDSMYVLVDYRPMLSFKTHMVAKTPSSWAVKGFTTSPTVPKTSQTHMNIVCYAHPMFNALSHLATDEVSPDKDEEGQMVYKMLSEGGYDSKKGVQGFELSDAGNFVTIAFTRYNATASAPGADGTVTWTPKDGDRKLISACERQTNIEARMILLSINADALCKLTEAGIAMVDSTLQYLLETDPLKVADCSLTFDNNNGTGVWSDEKNWAPRYNQIPNADVGAKIIKPCTVDIDHAIALSIKIEDNGKITIPATSALTVESSIRHMEGGILSAPSVSEISIAANAAGSGTLILNNITEDTRASVQMYSKASTDQSANTANWRWQYIGTPFKDVTDAMTNYYGSWLYLWNNGWTVVPKGGTLQPFAGYCITHPDGARTYNMTGTLATTADQTITVPAGQYMVIANSWTAPIQIDNFTDDDMKNLESRTIYFFNTGSDPNQSGTVQSQGVTGDPRWAAGTYVPVPIHSAPYSGDATIPAMQGFYVVGGVSEGSIHLDYDRLVRPQKTGQNIVSGPMHVRRRAAAADGEPNVLKLFVGGNRYDDRLILLEHDDFTNGFDDGWDGDKWSGNSVAPALWTLRNDNTHEAVSAIPDFEGTIIGFQAGEDDEYTFRFDYSGEADAIYLLDTETKVYTRVLTGNTYSFTTSDKLEHQRFVLTRSDAPQIATGVEPTSDSSLKGRAKKLLIEDKLYILLNGMLYDATGKLVR